MVVGSVGAEQPVFRWFLDERQPQPYLPLSTFEHAHAQPAATGVTRAHHPLARRGQPARPIDGKRATTSRLATLPSCTFKFIGACSNIHKKKKEKKRKRKERKKKKRRERGREREERELHRRSNRVFRASTPLPFSSVSPPVSSFACFRHPSLLPPSLRHGDELLLLLL